MTDVFVAAIADDFAEHGAEVVARVRVGDPVAYLKLIGSLVPREMVLQRESEPAVDFDNITFSEFMDLVEWTKRQAFFRDELMAADGSRIVRPLV